jgi:hypothetical protein
MPAARAIPGLQARATAPATLPTVFRLGHACKQGERLGLMGDCEQLGAWRRAVLMKVGGWVWWRGGGTAWCWGVLCTGCLLGMG